MAVTLNNFYRYEASGSQHTIDTSLATITEGELLVGFYASDNAATPVAEENADPWYRLDLGFEADILGAANEACSSAFVFWKYASAADAAGTATYTFYMSDGEESYFLLCAYAGAPIACENPFYTATTKVQTTSSVSHVCPAGSFVSPMADTIVMRFTSIDTRGPHATTAWPQSGDDFDGATHTYHDGHDKGSIGFILSSIPVATQGTSIPTATQTSNATDGSINITLGIKSQNFDESANVEVWDTSWTRGKLYRKLRVGSTTAFVSICTENSGANNSKVELGSSSNHATATLVTQTDTAWLSTTAGSLITFTVGLGGTLSEGNLWLFVTDDDGVTATVGAGIPVEVRSGSTYFDPSTKDVQVQIGSFTVPASTGIATVFATPSQCKAVRFFTVATTTKNSEQAGFGIGVGFTDGTREWAIDAKGVDGVDEDGIWHQGSDACILATGADDALDVFGTVSAFETNGDVKINFTTADLECFVFYEAWYGTDVTAYVADAAMQESAQNAKDTGYVNVGFAPDVLFMAGLGQGTLAGATSTTAVTARSGDHGINFGVTSLLDPEQQLPQWESSSASFVVSGDNFQRQSNVRAGHGLVYLKSAGDPESSHTIGKRKSTGVVFESNTQARVGYLALNIGCPVVRVHAGAFLKESTDGTPPISQSLPELDFTPQVVGILASVGRPSNVHNHKQTQNPLSGSYGVFTSDTVAYAFHMKGEDFGVATNPDETNQTYYDDGTIAEICIEGENAGLAVAAKADAVAITDSTPTISWTDSSARANTIGYWALDTASVASSTTLTPYYKLLMGGGC